MIKVCEKCGKEFNTKNWNKKVCDECLTRKCIVCGKLFFNKCSSVKTCSSFCSHKLAASKKDYKEITKKALETNKRNHNGKINLQTEEFKEQSKIASIKRYGTEHPTQSKVVKDKIKQTCLEKYGVENVFQSEIIKDKIKQTNLERYGVDNPWKSDKIKDKIKQTNLKKYGVNYYTETINIQNAIVNNMNKKYNVNYPAQSNEILDKMKQTNLKKYGVEYACLTDNCLESNHNIISNINLMFSKLLEDNNINYELEKRIISNSFDFLLTDSNILIEINPSYTHNSTQLPVFGNKQHGRTMNKNYHLNKTKLAEENGYRCIHIWDWDNWDKIINIFKPKKKISAHKTELKEVSKQEANGFLDKYHLQGSCNGNDINIGLFYKNELISLVTFGKPRYNKNYEYEFLRFVGHKDYSVYGGTNKLFNYFIEKYKPNSIISYCDKSKFEGKFFNNLGFIKEKETKPACHWYNLKTKQHFLDNSLRAIGADRLLNTNYGSIEKCGMNNRDIMLKEGFVEVYDCGQDVYTWKNNK